IGLSLLIRYSLQQFWTPLALPFPAIFSRDPIRLGTIVVSLEELGNILFAAATIGALQVFITHTKLGWAMQAVAQNRTLASVLGINVGRLVTITFMLNAALTAIAAILIAPVYLVKYDIGVSLGLKAFYAAIIGGFNQIRGALLGGLLVGVVETLSAAYISSHFRDAFALAIRWGLVLGFPALKVKHHYLAMVTLGFNIIVFLVLRNWESLTGGSFGISNVARPAWGSLSFKSDRAYYFYILAWAAVVVASA